LRLLHDAEERFLERVAPADQLDDADSRAAQPVDAAVELSGRGLIVLTGVAPRAVHDGAIETLDTLTAVDQIDCTLDRVEASAPSP